MTLSGPAALAAYRKADALVKAGRYEEALQVPMLPSDAKLIADRIAALAAGANRVVVQRTTKEN